MDATLLVRIALMLFGLVAFPGYLLVAMWRKRDEDRFHWLLRTLYTGCYIVLIYLAGPWDWVSYYLRYAWIILFAGVLVLAHRSAAPQSIRVRGGARTWNDLFTLLAMVFLIAISAKGYFFPDRAVDLAFPLRDGRYYVGQGGNSSIINYHNSHPAQKYALDIVELGALGARARGIYPTDPSRYAIFGKTLYSPCDGTVTKAIDGFADLNPPASDREHPAGNHLVIRCEGVNVVLAHLKRDSIEVRAGDTVSTGEPLALIGNSGNTSEPHLHIHAVRTDSPNSTDGDGVPVLFDGRFPVRNSVFAR